MADVSINNTIQQYSAPDKAASVQNDFEANLKEAAIAKGITPPAELTSALETSDKPSAPAGGLERSPEQDSLDTQMLGAGMKSLTPKKAAEEISTATQILVGLKALFEAGFDLNDLFKDRMNNAQKNAAPAANAPAAQNPSAKPALNTVV